MKSLMTLWQTAAHELAAWCDTSTTRDVETARDRSRHEGLSFFTITLPTYASDFERSLENGFVGSNLFLGFRRRGGLPVFLQGFLCRVFDQKTGVLLDSPCIESIFAIRQLTLMFKKIELPCSPRRMRAARDGFVLCEQDLERVDKEWTGVDDAEFSLTAALLFGDVFDAVNREVDEFSLLPKHGPGKTADRKDGNQKFVQTEWPERLESTFPYGEYALPNWRYFVDSQVRFLPPGSERPVKVKFVPKTLKAPRVIAVEPTAMQYAQQALMQSLVPKLEELTPSRYFVGFTDQIPNQDLARQGSLNGDLATLDLSEASDRVLNSHVLRILKPWPSLSEAVQACRTSVAELEDGRKIPLSKFASMGSALCFPMEAIVFTTLVFMGIRRHHTHLPLQSLIRDFVGRVRVYGDDIIVPVDCVPGVIGTLTAFGLKVNHHKSFWNGKFRESCGGDFYDGESVKPIRVKQKSPVSRRDAKEILSWVSMSNAFHKAGMWKTAACAAATVERAIGPLSCVPWDSSGVGLHSYLPAQGSRWEKDIQKSMVRTWIAHAPAPASPLSEHWALLKCLSSDWSDPTDDGHLERYGRPLAVHMKRGWVPAEV